MVAGETPCPVSASESTPAGFPSAGCAGSGDTAPLSGGKSELFPAAPGPGVAQEVGRSVNPSEVVALARATTTAAGLAGLGVAVRAAEEPDRATGGLVYDVGGRTSRRAPAGAGSRRVGRPVGGGLQTIRARGGG